MFIGHYKFYLSLRLLVSFIQLFQVYYFYWQGFYYMVSFFTFEPFGWFFWIIQGLFIVLLFVADYIANMIGIKKYGGSKAGIWGSTIGLLVGPFVIPFLGILIGPFIGAIGAEIIS